MPQTVRSRLPLYNSKDLSVLSWSLGQLGYLPDEPFVSEFMEQWQKQVGSSSLTEVVSCLKLFVKWRLLPDRDFLFSAFRVTQMRMSEGKPSARDISKMVHSLSYLGATAPYQWTAVMLRTFAAAPNPSADDISIVLYGVSNLTKSLPAGWALQQRDAFGSMCNTLRPLLQDMQPDSLQRAIAGLAYVDYYPGSRFLRAHKAACQRKLGAFTAAQQASVSAAYRQLVSSAVGPVADQSGEQVGSLGNSMQPQE